MATIASHATEIGRGERFEFGENWRRFLDHLNEDRILAAQKSLSEMLRLNTLNDGTFLDIGSGSGLFSLAARRLGARVHSFDFDPKSVACTRELKRRYFPEDPDWRIEEASVLDLHYIDKIGQFAVVYSWGVLHHTGAMWQALDNAGKLVRPGGYLFIALYNDQGGTSRRWKAIKKAYNRHRLARAPLLVLSFARLYGTRLIRSSLQGKPRKIFRDYAVRGMSLWRDLIDWVGGYPFEVAAPGEVFEFFKNRGFELTRLTTTDTLGCNEFVFQLRVPLGR